jgi:hypothetical protein
MSPGHHSEDIMPAQGLADLFKPFEGQIGALLLIMIS